MESHNRTHLKDRHKSLFFLSWVQQIEDLHPWNRPLRTISVDCFCGNRVQELATSRDGLESDEGVPQTKKKTIYCNFYRLLSYKSQTWNKLLIIINSIFSNKNLFKENMPFVCNTFFHIGVSRTNGQRKDVQSGKHITFNIFIKYKNRNLYCLKNVKN